MRQFLEEGRRYADAGVLVLPRVSPVHEACQGCPCLAQPARIQGRAGGWQAWMAGPTLAQALRVLVCYLQRPVPGSRQGRFALSCLNARSMCSSFRPLALAVVATIACQARTPAPDVSVPLRHEVYVWQRRWVPSVARAVAEAPERLGALRVLALEYAGPGRREATPEVDLEALKSAGRPVAAVVRIDGAGPLDGFDLGGVAAIVNRWRAAGVAVRNLEIDYDCGTARLGAYATWLRAHRPELGGLPIAITALPAWIGGDVGPLLDASDSVTLQVHAVRAPVLFSAREARRDVDRWAKVSNRRFAVALPTYRVRLASGRELVTDPAEVERFLDGLRSTPVPGLEAVTWFRLGHEDDPDAWTAGALSEVLAGAAPRARVAARLVPAANGALDVVLKNEGRIDGRGPARLGFRGPLDGMDGVSGYSVSGSALAADEPPWLRPGERLTIGWVRGQEVSLALP
jgi:Protein of unknown function (DUF3142)